MKELTDEQVREMRTRKVQKGKAEVPPILTKEDEKILDAAWKEAGTAVAAKKSVPNTK